MRRATPQSWCRLRLGDLGLFNTSSVDKLVQPHEAPVFLVNYMDVYRHRHIGRNLELQTVTANLTERARFQVQVGDILFTPSSETPDDIGHSAVITDEHQNALHSYHTVRLRPHGRVPLDVHFCGYFANAETVRGYFSRQAAGSTRYTLSLDSFRNALVDVPPIREQQRIAEVLLTVDEAIEQTKALIAKTQRIQVGLMHDLFTRGVTADRQLRPPREEAPQLYKESPLGWLPKEWDAKELRTWLNYISYGFTNPMPETEDGPYMVTAADVSGGEIQYATCRRTSQHAFNYLLTHKSRPRIGDVLLTKDGTLGRTAIVTRENVCINQSVAVLRPANPVDSSFLAAMLSSPRWQQKMMLDAGGSAIKHIYITVVDKMVVAWPPADERDAIVDSVQCCVSRLAIEEEQKAKLLALRQGLMNDLLTGCVTIKSAPELKEVAVNV